MTVSSQTPINRSTGNGVTTVFPYGFKIISEADIEVTVDGVVKTLNVDYTVSGVGNEAGGNVTMTAAPANLASVVRRRNMALVRTTDYQDQGEMPAATLDSDFDSAVLMIQQVDEQIWRAVTVPAGVTGFDGQLPDPVASMFLRINSAGDGFDLVSEVTPGALTVTHFIETLLNDTDATAARTTLGAQVAGSYQAAGSGAGITSLPDITSLPNSARNIGRLISTINYTSSGTYTKATNNPSYIEVEVIGGGGGGGGSFLTATVGAGGGSGGYSRKKILASALSASETVTVGVAGTAGTTAGSAGGAGGTSSFGAHCSATGGAGGAGATTLTFTAGGAYGTGSGGDVNGFGQFGGNGQPDSTNGYSSSGPGGNSILGGAGNGVVNNANAPGGAGSSGTGSGGGGGSAGAESKPGGPGGSGRVIVREYA